MGFHDNHRDRMREKIRKTGIKNLANHEILEYLLYGFIPRKDTNEIAHRLIDTFGSFASVMQASEGALRQVKGMTDNAALFLHSLPDVFYTFVKSSNEEPIVIDNLSKVVSFVKANMIGLSEENVLVLCLDKNFRYKSCDRLFQGNENHCEVDINRILDFCSKNKAPNVIVAHNHIGCTSHPSNDDVRFTKFLVSALYLHSITLIDHIILGTDGHYSFRQTGEIEYYAQMQKDLIEDIKN